MTTHNKKKVTLKDVADSANVSISTASRALKGARGISEPVNARVRQIAEELGYTIIGQLDVEVTILSTMNITEVGQVEFIQGLMHGIEQTCKELNIKPTISMVGSGQKAADLPVFKRQKQACLLLSFHDNQLIDALCTNNIPAFIVNGFDPMMRLPAVAPANLMGGRLAVEHLIGLGHQRILNLTYPDRVTICQRLAGFKQGLAEAGLNYNSELVIDLEAMRTDVAYSVIKDYLSKHSSLNFTAVQCCNDSVALGVMAALTEAGYRIPGDVSVIGFDDISTAAMAMPSLSTIHAEREAMGAWAVRRLLDTVQNGEGAVHTYTEMAVRLVERGSTGPTAKSGV
ncbi:MAG: LacI family DNA-binding transcriptional regulator [Reinekea sp.]|jgi:DNA-binding LacI/PurR family transcriptional regulator